MTIAPTSPEAGVFSKFYHSESKMASKSEKQKEFSNLSKVEEIREYLETKGPWHTFFFQYTTLKALQGMLESQKLFLTRMDKLNDALECRGAEERKKRVYIASFSFGTAESMAMWSMYGAPYKQGIRLTIPRRAITKTLKDFAKKPVLYFTETGHEIPFGGNATLKMMDVVYAHNGSLEHHREKLLKKQGDFVADAKDDPVLAFCIKNEIWLAECETRMVLELAEELPCDEEKVAIDFDYAVDNLEVTGSPCLCLADLKNELKNFEKERIHQSVAFDQVYFKECKDCEKRTAFCKKNKKKTEKKCK